MRNLLLLFVFVIAITGVQAQQTVGSRADLQRFMRTTTNVVQEQNPMLMYNSEIKNTVEKHWDLTKYEFVTFSTEDFDKARMDSTKSFLIMNQIFYDKDKTKAKYNFLCVELGGDYEFVRQMPDIASVPVSYVDVDEEYYDYKLGILCRFLQNHIKLTLEHPELNSKNIVKYYYNHMAADIHNKTLYLLKDDLAKDVNTEAKIKAVYPYNVKIVTRDEIKAAIDNHDENVVLLHKVGPEGSKRKARCYVALLGASDAQLYYFGWHMISDKKPEGLLASDFKKLTKAKKKK